MDSGITIGVDLVSVASMQAMLAAGGTSFQEICFTAGELASSKGVASRLAARWAAKEAAMKALGHGIGEIAPTDIEVTGRQGQPPMLLLHGSARRLATERRVDLALSMSHENEYAVAFVVATPQMTIDPSNDSSEDGNNGAN